MNRVQEFDFSVNILRAILWQYDKAPNLLELMQSKHDWYNENAEDFLNDWFVNVFDLRTANNFGLAVWAIILNIPLFTDEIESPPDYPAFGFGPFAVNFDNGNFATDIPGAGPLSTEEKRTILRLRYYQLTTRGAIPEINRALFDVFDGDVYATDGYNMTLTYTFSGTISSSLIYVITQFDILPRPAGVQALIVRT